MGNNQITHGDKGQIYTCIWVTILKCRGSRWNNQLARSSKLSEAQREVSQTQIQTEIWLYMMTSSNGNIFRLNGPLCGEFTGPGEFPAHRPVTRGFGVFFDLRLNKRLSKQPWGWWFETPPRSLWRHCNDPIRNALRYLLFSKIQPNGYFSPTNSVNFKR